MKKTILTLIFLLQFSALSAQEGTVVCLHGFFRSFKCMIPIGNTLKNEGLDTYLWNYRSRSKTIEEHADDLVLILKRIAAAKPGEPIHFVTHSLGGIIVRTTVNHPECPEEAKIGKAILLAPPNQGAVLARKFKGCPLVRGIFGNKTGRQLLTYQSDEMNGLGQFPSSMEVMVIAGNKGSRLFRHWVNKDNDGKVSVEETYLSTPHEHRVIKVSHSWIMTSRATLGMTKEFLIDSTP